jgi:hypothetical protein
MNPGRRVASASCTVGRARLGCCRLATRRRTRVSYGMRLTRLARASRALGGITLDPVQGALGADFTALGVRRRSKKREKSANLGDASDPERLLLCIGKQARWRSSSIPRTSNSCADRAVNCNGDCPPQHWLSVAYLVSAGISLDFLRYPPHGQE